MKLLDRLLGGRPMKQLQYLFWDGVENKEIFLWEDKFGRQWMAPTAWGWFRIAPPTPEEVRESLNAAREARRRSVSDSSADEESRRTG